MTNVLVVDDEREIADHMFELISSISDRDLSVYRAYSATEAIGILTDVRMDIVISDIRMPGMSGLDLLDRINDRWPYCAVIFLTGFQEFDSIYRATRHGAARYLLKTMTDEDILSEVDRTLAAVEKRRLDAVVMEATHERLQRLRPIAMDHVIRRLLGSTGEGAADDHLTFLKELGSPIDPDSPVYLLVGRLDASFGIGVREAETIQETVAAACEQYLGFRLRHHTLAVDRSHVVTLLQASDNEGAGAGPLIRGNLDVIQTFFERHAGRPIALIVSESAFSLSAIGRVYRMLVVEINERVGTGEDMLIVSKASPDVRADEAAELDQVVDAMVVALETGQRDLFNEQLGVVVRVGEREHDPNHLRELYYSIALALYKRINRTDLLDRVAGDLAIERILRMEQHDSWVCACDYLRRVASEVFGLRESDGSARANKIIELVRHEVETGIGGDLSLVRLADVAKLNPAYLSRLFKRETGRNLSAFVADRRIRLAKELLGEPLYRIKEVGERIGYAIPAYFTRFFKLKTGMSPQQYRNSLGHPKDRQEK